MLTLNLINFGDFQLRKTVFDYAQREIAPKAAEIDKTNSFDDLRVIYCYLLRFKCITTDFITDFQNIICGIT